MGDGWVEESEAVWDLKLEFDLGNIGGKDLRGGVGADDDVFGRIFFQSKVRTCWPEEIIINYL